MLVSFICYVLAAILFVLIAAFEATPPRASYVAWALIAVGLAFSTDIV